MCAGLSEVLTRTENERRNKIGQTFHWDCTNHVDRAKHLVNLAAHESLQESARTVKEGKLQQFQVFRKSSL